MTQPSQPCSALHASSRRTLLQWATASAAALALHPHAWSQPRFASNPFALGVASGSPSHDSVVLWTRLVQTGFLGRSLLGAQSIPVRWELAHDAAFTRLVQSGQVLAQPALAHSVHVEPAGLDSDRWYFYRFHCGEATSPVGRTRTFPAPEAPAARLRLAFASCQRWEHGHYGAYRHMLQEDLDTVLFLGDYIYEYPAAGNAVRLPSGGWVLTLDDYRARYALHKSEPALQAMHAACPWLVTWDDHEVQNDYAGIHPGDSGPPVADFLARRAAAYQAYYEHMPLRASVLTQGLDGLARGAEMRIYSRVAFGNLASVYLLDDRQYRDPQVCTPGGKPGSGVVSPGQCQTWNDSRRTLLGQAQEQWLEQALRQGSPHWNLIAQQTLFGPRNVRTADNPAYRNDGWDGYPGARQRLVDTLQRQRVANPVLLGGDVHENWVGHIKADYANPASPSVGVEFCGTSISSRGGGNTRIPERLAANPHFVFADGERRGYGVVELTPGRLTTTLRVVDDATQADTGASTLARFHVASGSTLLQRDLQRSP